MITRSPVLCQGGQKTMPTKPRTVKESVKCEGLLRIIVDQRKLTLTPCAKKYADRMANPSVWKYQTLSSVILRQKHCIVYNLKKYIKMIEFMTRG